MASFVKSLQRLFKRHPKDERHPAPVKAHRLHWMEEHEILRLKILGGVLKK
ncbi:hypothetical protein [Geobacter sp. DSM 9736]|uniref:hypothetical protein n=1 Tax=Geobacter sp. DSM 9736 TaxID=1277350 RepID=UPI000B600BD4|nr:hypothetical protein [Geobacter sp. DSM 9736]SNB45322.1 hypothetical protein SAMN06269301_0729 [Geobacter sp. DSM 9736]